MSENVIFVLSLAIPISVIFAYGAVTNSDWWQHRCALRAVRYEAELAAARKALRDAQAREDI